MKQKAVIVSGYFKPIHKGHIEYFQNAIANGDKLFVTVNSDLQKELKGSAFMENEVLAKEYCERLVRVAVERYINVKTLRQKNTVDNLQSRVDSIANLLSRKTASSAALQTSASTMDINPLYKSGAAIATETTVRDKTMLATIFASVTQNLEMAKFTLSQETPVIQKVDSPLFPLTVNKVSKLKNVITFSLIFSFLIVILVIVKRMI